MKVICQKGGLQGNFTNHSGKRTCATQLYTANVDEQEIMRRTGHRSQTAVRKYKRSNDAISQNVSKIVTHQRKRKMNAILQKLSRHHRREFAYWNPSLMTTCRWTIQTVKCFKIVKFIIG